ncbi:hypothetical protein ACFW6E_43660 [Streptomyces olivaceoviridis]|uniref:hypothetical protein n=1 Tax=Streptomyces olivaceoviridis TaxID=1921 RepID=UPI00367897F3
MTANMPPLLSHLSAAQGGPVDPINISSTAATRILNEFSVYVATVEPGMVDTQLSDTPPTWTPPSRWCRQRGT